MSYVYPLSQPHDMTCLYRESNGNAFIVQVSYLRYSLFLLSPFFLNVFLDYDLNFLGFSLNYFFGFNFELAFCHLDTKLTILGGYNVLYLLDCMTNELYEI